MDDRAVNRLRDEWVGVNFLLKEMESLRSRGLIPDDAFGTIVGEYSARRTEIERASRFAEAIRKARDLAVLSPREALAWSVQAREYGPDRPEGWVEGINLLRKMRRWAEADDLADEAAAKFPGFRTTPVDRSPAQPPTPTPARARR